ncbi:hypothetical protein KGM_210411 [Danaus plexippus plexippus]|uniref:Uncharacterized protein n=1 Tax=Danaus plexippus plexippus TaxID=278856 RepID=A0A212EU84_DANPL|nr:hypothetical protein KGM_210411 [Danaus plexippus plexippus]
MTAKSILFCVFLLLCTSGIDCIPAPGATTGNNQIISHGDVTIITSNKDINNGNIALNEND